MAMSTKPTLRLLFLGCVVLGTLLCIQRKAATDLFVDRRPDQMTQTPLRLNGTGNSSQTTSVEASSHRKHIVHTSGCSIPDFDLFDVSIRRLYKKVGKYACPGKPSFIRMVNLTVPTVYEAALKEEFALEPNDINCTYREIFRNESIKVPDTRYFIKDAMPLLFGEPLATEYNYVRCAAKGKMFHEEFLLVPLLKAQVEEQCRRIEEELNSTLPRLNVLVLGMDSVSRLNFNRHMPKSGKFVREVLKAYELFGYNKVGQNSYPNQTPLLTGLSGSEAKNLSTGKFFDGLNFLWKEYKKRGYRTVFYEEMPRYGLYSYVGNGLKHAPTDYYARHAIMAIDASSLKKNKARGYCVGPKLPLELYLDYFIGLTDVFEDRPFFAYVWMSELAHDHLNMAGHSDVPFLNALRALYDRGVFNNTVLAFLSDHGLRFGALRNTYIGRFEDSLPYALLAFPEWFLRSYPDYARALQVNQKRLTTHYDMHATLLQLVNFPNMTRTDTKHGQSLFYEILENRTCAAASIPSQFCTCVEPLLFPTKHPLARQIAAFVLAEVNKLTQKHLKDKCVQWKLKEVVSIRYYTVEETKSNSTATDYWLRLAAIPEGGLLEATVRHNVDWKASRFSIVQQPDRIDWYSSHSQCAKNSPFAKYCYCKKL